MTNWNESAWFALFAGVAFKSTVVLGVAWIAAFLLRGRSAAARHLVWTAASAAVLALPFLSASLPVIPLPGGPAPPVDFSVMFRARAGDGADPAVSQRSTISAPVQS